MASKQNEQQYESDSAKIVHRHLSDPNHVITDEEIASVRVGVTSPPDDTTQQAVRDAHDRIADRKADGDDDTAPGAQKSTPWDVID